MEALVQKYNVPVPRYTSYPTVPFWAESNMPADKWMQQVERTFNKSNARKGISIYLHLPFCESLCTYCGCNKRITKNHRVEKPYISSLLREWEFYLKYFGEVPAIREMHLGGGTPTFFSPDSLERLLSGILEKSKVFPGHSFGFEGSPNSTGAAHLKALYKLGFKRLSLGVQDFDPKVQNAVNRINSFEQVREVVDTARKTGYTSINLDLIYGLPFQDLQTMQRTLKLVGRLYPDRIAFYSYAHVPWKSPSQRGYRGSDLPKDAEKRALYEMGKDYFTALGYSEIGMDHFALKADEIAVARRQGKLHRNFMGYTTTKTDLLIGLGVSAISDSGTSYAQNEKVVEKYQQKIDKKGIAVYRGHFLTQDDQRTRDRIMELICNGKTDFPGVESPDLSQQQAIALRQMEEEGLVELSGDSLVLTESGKPYIRNICSLLDRYLGTSTNKTEQVFSRAI